ncbi:Thioredoxin reductase [Desulfamplus magnetovallimortis]|uniref:Thioredoxin reductase n=1 Tax=Desulfamplus magnetovallimortis TaxID=1246637 RepID=A0A1W1HE42_9BACT|nr:thioredoxin-disulfide reductase [Desulfamplus magnetovallimortis]SLM30749.1 Thioredoxin reductase [Desulfamplus magnetovallimortis]
MPQSDYDLVIIGGGPAGLTAGIYAARARLNVVLYEKAAPGGQVIISDWIENYPGFPDGISGYDLGEKMLNHAKNLGLTIETEDVTGLDLTGDIKVIHLGPEKSVTTKAIIIASGASPKTLNVGEDKFRGKGVSFCATCDGPFFRDKTVVAVGGGDTAVQESLFLTRFVKKLYLVHRRDELRATKILQERAFKNDKIEFVWDSVVTGMDGLFAVENVNVKNVKTEEESSIKANGCFIWIGITPNTDFVGDDLNRDEWGFIFTNDRMETSIPGVFAAGDVRTTPLKQIATAVGDAAIAVMGVEHYIENINS